MLTETWLYNTEIPLYTMDGYTAMHSCRNSRGGGVAIYIKNTIRYQELNSSDPEKPYNWICLSINDKKLILSVIYRPPSFPAHEFLNEFEFILKKYPNNHIVIGDTNINLLDFNCPTVRDYNNMLALNGFKIVNKIDTANATRVAKSSRTLIDHVISNSAIKNNCNIKIEENCLSDHKKILMSIKQNIKKYKPKILIKKNILNINKFKQGFLAELSKQHVHTFQHLIMLIAQAKENSQVSKVIRCRENNRWVTPDLLALIKKRDQVYKQQKRFPNNIHLNNTFKVLKNSVNNKIKTLKNKHFRDRWEAAGTSAKKQWDIINTFIKGTADKNNIYELEINNASVTDSDEIVNSLNKYFSEIGVNIIKDIQNEKKKLINSINLREVVCDVNCFLTPVDDSEISSIIQNLKRNAAPGHDNVTVLDLLNLKEHIVKILVVLINEVISNGEFPNELKIVRVCPIFKSGKKTNINNYRPISLISVFSKIIEAVIKIRMLGFLGKYVTTDPFQYGFLEHSSTLSATVDLTNYLSENLDRGNVVIGVFVDLRKAFDVVCHQRLLEKLSCVGFRGVTLNLIKTYLLDRKQYITIDGITSSIQTNNCGVPQGSVLGPLLYSIFVMSLRLSQLKAQYYTFADDTVLLYSGGNLEELGDTVNEDLEQYHRWLLYNNLKINIDKTKYMLFKQKNKTVCNVDIKIDNIAIEKINTVKYLGLVLDEYLSWSGHIEHIKNKIIPLIGAIYRCRFFLSHAAKLKVYNSYFLSVLRYLLPVWGTCNTTNFNKIKILQNKVLKTLFNLDYQTHTETVYTMLDITPISNILRLEQAKLMYKIINKKQKCNTKIMYSNEFHTHKTRNQNDIYLAPVRTNAALHNPLSEAAQAFNSLPYNLKTEKSFSEFVKKLKAEIFI